ncbi:MAG: polyhydroxyalkanoic acid system family protein [Chromatiaceae bacterium]
MARIHIEREHGLGLEEARRQIDQVAETLRDQLQARFHWEGDRLEFERSGARGVIEVAEDRVTLDIRLGLLLRPLKGTIERTITEQLDSHLA